ncbi:substrate binding domain-containing protein [Marinobacterium aestuariivivens]|uniref:Substrate binding domain-containing protein n=1 Tax=Marinobacterium aestuariivivens TaxID=1698799 RepID=A0ABW2A052_9GAMM
MEIGIKILNDIICRFSKRYPLINLDVILTNDLIDIVKEGYDVAIRGGALKDSNLICRKIMSTKLHLCASPDYLAKHGVPGHPDELADHTLISFPYPSPWALRLSRGDESVDLQAQVKFRTNSLDLVLKGAWKGLGIGVLPSSVCSTDVKAGRLVVLLENWRAFDIGLYALFQDRKTPKKVDLFLDFLARELADIEQTFI